MSKFARFPDHIAIVPDGNGRWAERRQLPRLHGHQAGAENMSRMVKYLSQYPVKHLTMYGFSTENWNRPQEEVSGLFRILVEIIDQEVPGLHRMGIRLRHFGRLKELPELLQSKITYAVELTQNNSGLSLNLAFNYGGRAEIIDAIRRLITDNTKAEDVNEEMISRHLYTAGLPDVDLLIRTGDELRLSNFLIWQTAYSEYYFTDVLWPDFTQKEADEALLAYGQRKRRFGGL